MLIDDIDFADLYLQQLRLAHRTEKTPDHWDQRAEKMAENCASPTDSYLQQLTSKIDLQGAQTLFDMGCGPGTVSLALADKLTTIYGVDYSQGMLNVAARRAAALKADNVHWIQRAWEEDWSDLPRCDIAVASRSTLVADMRQAMSKLNNQARLRVYTTHLVSTSFVSPAIQRAAGREVIELPNYILHSTSCIRWEFMLTLILSVDKIANRITAPGNVLSRTSAGVWARLTTMSVSGYIAGINNKMLVPSPLPAATGRSSGGIAYRRRHCDDFPFSGTNRCVTSGRYPGR